LRAGAILAIELKMASFPKGVEERGRSSAEREKRSRGCRGFMVSYEEKREGPENLRFCGRRERARYPLPLEASQKPPWLPLDCPL
jgi:hypothetical protein